MPQALIVAHGQPSSPDQAETALAQLAGQVQKYTKGYEIGSATLAAPSALEAALATSPNVEVIYPLFMTKGWFVTQALPKRLGDTPIQILDPFGLDPALPRLAADAVQALANQKGWPLEDLDVVLAAHGSGRSRNPATVTRDFGHALQAQLACKDLVVGFVEEDPSIESAARTAGEHAICLPFFAAQGGHADDDVPNALRSANFQGEHMPVLGALSTVPELIAQSIVKALDLL